MKILLSGKSGKHFIVDEQDLHKVMGYKWYLHSAGYVVRTYMKNYKTHAVYLHREILRTDKFVDHVNGDPLDNRRANLRICSQAENTRNQKLSTKNSSGYKGVRWDKKRSKWYGKINYMGKQFHLGSYDNAVDAAKAYNAKALEFFGQFARLNKLD